MSIEATIYVWKLRKNQITPTEKLILLSYADRADEEGRAFPSLKRLSEDTLLDRKTLIKSLQSICEKGILIKTGDMKGRTKQVPVYQFPPYIFRENQSATNSTTFGTVNNFSYSNSTKNGTCTSTKNGTGNLKENLQIEKKKNIKKKKESSSTNQKQDYKDDERFMSFYSQYPIKKKPHEAYKMWLKLNPDDELIEKLIDDVKNRLLNDTQWAEGYIPYPATYLNPESRSWEDEIFNREKIKTESAQKAKEKQEEETKKRIEAQEKAAFERHQNEINKQEDAKDYRKVLRATQSQAQKSALKGLKDLLKM